MPFSATCPFCPAKIKLPDKALGASIACPKCGSYFTAAPADDGPAKGPLAVRALRQTTEGSSSQAMVRPPAPAEAQTQPAESSWQPANVSPQPAIGTSQSAEGKPAIGRTQSAEVNRQSSMGQSNPVVAAPGISGLTTRRPIPSLINVWGLCAITMAGVGWSVAALGIARWPAILLSFLGLAVVGLGVLATLDQVNSKDRRWLILGGVFSLVLLAVALFLPHWLHPRWAIDIAATGPDPNRLLLVSLDGRNVVKELDKGDWVDASQGAIRLGDVDIRIEWVKVYSLPLPEAKDRPAPSRLLISVAIMNPGFVGRVPYEGAGKHVDYVRDDRGDKYPRCPFPDSKATGQDLLPGDFLDDLLVFEPPPPSVGHLELELPAAAWGRRGTCRFRIPRNMITFDSPDPKER